MYKTIKLIDCDIIYLSYDEPNKERNYADLKNKFPWAKRVDGVHGSDSAHKACAKLAETERVTIIDGDNIVKPEMINAVAHLTENCDLDKCVLSFPAYNIINGLVYGNGSIKNWPTKLILDMRTHENADCNNIKTQVDFCWEITYLQMDDWMSWVHNNASPHQAWRAGFREGVKMCLIEGTKCKSHQLFANQMHWKNYHRLLAWMNVGSDVDNGLWAIYGARLGTYMTMLTDWDHLNVRTFSYLNNLFDEVKPNNLELLDLEIKRLGYILKDDLQLAIGPQCLDKDQSRFFKIVYSNPPKLKHPWIIQNV
jgi:hypothetical protein